MRISVYGKGHESKSPTPIRKQRSNPSVRIGVFRRGGLGDGLIENAIITAIKRAIPESSISGYADESFYKMMMDHPACSSMRVVPWTPGMYSEVQVRHSILSANEVDLWFDVKPVPFVDGRNRELFVDMTHLGELAEIEGRYYRFNSDEIIDLYRRHGCQGQPQLVSKLLGIEASIRDANLRRERPPSGFVLPSWYATISAGWTDTSHYKGWTVEGWGEVSRWLSEQGICPVQVGMGDEQQIPGAMSATSLSMWQQIDVIHGASLHLGSDGFLCHVASAADVPTIVLWGPTPHEVWGHPGQTAVISPIARNIWWTHYHWAHDPGCQETMRAIEPDAVIEAIGRTLDESPRRERAVSFPKSDGRHCIVGQVQGGFGDGLVTMSKLRSLVQPGKRTIVVAIPDGNGNLENVKRTCEMFSFVDDVLVHDGPPLDADGMRIVIEKWDGDLVIDEFYDLRYAVMSEIDASFSKLSTTDLRRIPTLPDWIPEGDVCCLQPATRQHKDENSVWPDYWKTMDMVEDVLGILVILIGGTMDVPHITREPRLGVNAVSKLSFEQSLFLVAKSRVGISMDSWVAHCAAVFGNVSIYLHQGTTLQQFLDFVKANGGDAMSIEDSPDAICDAIRRGIVRRS